MIIVDLPGISGSVSSLETCLALVAFSLFLFGLAIVLLVLKLILRQRKTLEGGQE